MTEMDTLTLVRWRLAEGRTIADSDVHKLVAQIDQLKDELSEAIERGNDWCDQAHKARAERDRLRAAIVRWYLAHKLDTEATDAEMEVSTDRLEDIARAELKKTGPKGPPQAPLFGSWPGDESDEEIERLLKDF
jgi:hypothetical protein